MYYVILIFGSWNFTCGAECKVAKTKLDEIFIKKFNIRIFFQTYKTYAAVARKWAEVRGSFRTRCDGCLHIVRSNKKSFTVRTRCLHSLCRIDVGDVASSETAEAIIRVFQLTRNRVTRFLGSSNVNAIDRAKWIASFSKGSRIIRRLCWKWGAGKVENR